MGKQLSLDYHEDLIKEKLKKKTLIWPLVG